MNDARMRRLLVFLLWLDAILLITSPLVLHSARPEVRPLLIADLWAVACGAAGVAFILRARPPPRR